jgi:hypothetical protein
VGGFGIKVADLIDSEWKKAKHLERQIETAVSSPNYRQLGVLSNRVTLSSHKLTFHLCQICAELFQQPSNLLGKFLSVYNPLGFILLICDNYESDRSRTELGDYTIYGVRKFRFDNCVIGDVLNESVRLE